MGEHGCLSREYNISLQGGRGVQGFLKESDEDGSDDHPI
jgi:hypothetical protein